MGKPVSPPELSINFWRVPEIAYQRVTVAEWKAMLLAEMDTPLVMGQMRQVVAKKLGAGVVELRLAPLTESTP